MQEFVTIPVSLINILNDEKPYSKLQAYVDILNMAGENGEFYSTVRKLMNRWGWGNSKTTLFLKKLEDQDAIKSQTRHKQDTLFIVNTGFSRYDQDTNKTQTRHKQDTKIKKSVEDLQMILNLWNELSTYGIDPIPEMGISSVQYQSLKSIVDMYGTDDVIKTIERIKISDFLKGKKGGGWKISFNWFIKEGNYQKVRSGKYDGGNIVTNHLKRRDDSQQSEEEELIGDEWVDI